MDTQFKIISTEQTARWDETLPLKLYHQHQTNTRRFVENVRMLKRLVVCEKLMDSVPTRQLQPFIPG